MTPTPVAWMANDGSAVHLSYWSDLDTPLYTEAQLNQAKADALREAADYFGGMRTDSCPGMHIGNELRRMAADIEGEKE